MSNYIHKTSTFDTATARLCADGRVSGSKHDKDVWWDVEPIFHALHQLDTSRATRRESEQTLLAKEKTPRRLGSFSPVWRSLAVPTDDAAHLEPLLELSAFRLEFTTENDTLESKYVDTSIAYHGHGIVQPKVDDASDEEGQGSHGRKTDTFRSACLEQTTDGCVPVKVSEQMGSMINRANPDHTDGGFSSTCEDGPTSSDSGNRERTKARTPPRRRRHLRKKNCRAKENRNVSDSSDTAVSSGTAPGSKLVISESARRLVPAWITPQLIPVEQKYIQTFIAHDRAPLEIRPVVKRDLGEQRRQAVEKVAAQFSLSAKSLMTTYAQGMQRPLSVDPSAGGLHVFVDWSNIIVGFHQTLKKARRINLAQRVPRVPMLFDVFALILERGRLVSRRELVGSAGTEADSRHPRKFSSFQDAATMGYDVSVLQRVVKWPANVNHSQRTEPWVDAMAAAAPRDHGWVMAEQGVDEVLQMKMLESIVDVRTPSTMVVATGDGAPAEFSAGFLTNINRALEKGWMVELITWRDFASSAYSSEPFRRRWGASFVVIELDDYLEELLGISML